MIWTKGTHQSAKFQAFNCSHEIWLNLYFERLLLLKVLKFQLKKYRRFMSHDTEDWCEIRRKTRTLEKSQNWDFDGILSSKIKKCMILKFTEDLCIGAVKNDAKFEEELTCCFKIIMRNLTNFDPSATQKSQKYAL